MNITVTGRRMSVNDELKDYVEARLDDATKVFKIDPMNVEVVLRRESRPSRKNPTTCEVTLRTKGHIIRTEAFDEEATAAVDIAAAKLERQLRKYKTKVIDRRQKAERLADAIESEAIAVLAVPQEEPVPETDPDALVRIKEIELDVLDTEQALLQMDLLGHDFYVYVAAEDGTTCVLYRRREGGYGMIKPRLESMVD